ncbi:MAG: hypothetical protein GC165_13175 [Armatimonadetes bacterium]|nr:hypothetical protein [Armatimonadota bacterium]MBS1725979.1 DUF4339 domain-containing protein [Armatimonadota bacterium]
MGSNQYIVRSPDGREYGPVDLVTLQQWVQQGRVTHDTKVRNLGNGMLLMASNMPELDGHFAALYPRQHAAITSGMLYAGNQAPVADHWEDYKFVFIMSVLGLVLSLAIGWFSIVFCIVGMVRAWKAAKEQKPMSGLAFTIALFCMFGAIAIPFLMGFWIESVLKSFLHIGKASDK